MSFGLNIRSMSNLGLANKTLGAGELVLEPLRVDHAQSMFAVLREPALYRHLDSVAPPSVEQLRSVYVRRAFVFSSAQWGRGHAFAATQAMLAHLGSECGVDCFLAKVEAQNLRSVRLLERLGFRAESRPDTEADALSPTELMFSKRRDERHPD